MVRIERLCPAHQGLNDQWADDGAPFAHRWSARFACRMRAVISRQCKDGHRCEDRSEPKTPDKDLTTSRQL